MDEDRPLMGSLNVRQRPVVLILVVSIIVLCVAALITSSVSISIAHKNNSKDHELASECPASLFPLQYTSFYETKQNSKPVQGCILLKNGTVWSMRSSDQTPLQGFDVLMEDGKILGIGKPLSPPPACQTIQLEGRHVTPGLVDMHSHLGVYSLPDTFGTADGNEMTNPTFPQVRVLDALNPNDPAITGIRSGGVTSSLVLPGSGNLMGGEAVYVKLRGKTGQEMLIHGAPRAFKMACGENPKRVYGSQGVTPMSRMGNGWLMREKFFQAAQLKQQQERWECENVSGETTSPKPIDLSLEPLVAILGRKARLMVHCYKVEDLEMIVRTSHEFNFGVAAFHHALEAWRVPNLLLDNNISAAIFTDNWGYKMEAYDASVKAAKILSDAGVNLAIKSDHPVIYAKYLILEAAKAYHYQLSAWNAIKAVTLAPALAIGLGDRLGSLDIGKDADVVVWDRFPLLIGAHPDKVIIDGQVIDDFQRQPISYTPLSKATLAYTGPTACQNVPSASFAVKGVTVYTMDDSNTVLTDATIVVQDGVVTCMSNACTPPTDIDTYTLNGGVIIPGIVSVGAPVGLVEVESEDTAQDGVASGDGTNVHAIDGVRMNAFKSLHVKNSWAGGVTNVIVGPLGSNTVSGIGGGFHTYGPYINAQTLIHPATSLHLTVGNAAKGSFGSISAQIGYLREQFLKASTLPETNPWNQTISGKIPVVVAVDQADEIISVARLQSQFGFKLIILGGAEAHIVADVLAAQNISVVLTARATPDTFEKMRSTPHAPVILRNAGVQVALAAQDVGSVRNLRWEAGYAVAEGVSYLDALASITKTPAAIFNLINNSYNTNKSIGNIAVGKEANFVAFDGDALSIESTVQLVTLAKYVECKPQQP